MKGCDHKFVDSTSCLRCGASVEMIRGGVELAGPAGPGAALRGPLPLPYGTDEERRQDLERRLDERGPDGVTERWKQTFLPPQVRAVADEVLASRHPKLAPAWLPIVAFANEQPELEYMVYWGSWLQLFFRLGFLQHALSLSLAEVQHAATPEICRMKIDRTVRALRLARQQAPELTADSYADLEARARRRRAEQDGK